MSRQEIVDAPAAACPQLSQFLAAYFHQDWALDTDRWEAVVDEFATESPHSAVVATADELRDVLAAHLNDVELAALVSTLGGSVSAEAFGMTPTSWLDAVLMRLRSAR